MKSHESKGIAEICFENELLKKEVQNKTATLRDQFAMAALNGWLGSYSASADFPSDYVDTISAECYKMADAMLAAREV